MKTLLAARKRIQGGALIFAIVLISFAAIAILGYLKLLQTEYRIVARSQTWNGALVLAESGVEDALALLNKNAGSVNSLANWSDTATQDGWQAVATLPYPVFRMSRTNAGFGYYDVYVTNVVNGTFFAPAILSIGTAYWALSNSSNGGPAVRKVFVQATGDATGSGGLTARTSINFNGNKPVVDSYNSASPSGSNWHPTWFYRGKNYGTYTNTLRTANVIVGTDGPLINADGANIYGYVDTGPGGTVSVKSGGTVGDLNWIGPNPSLPLHYGIQSGHQRDDMSVDFPPVALPSPGTWLSVAAPTNKTIVIGGVTYTNSNPGDPSKSSFTIGGVPYSLFITNMPGRPGTPTNMVYYQYSVQLGQSLFIDASNVVLYFSKGVKCNTGDNLTLNTNASVEIYCDVCFDTGNGIVNNLYQYADALRIYGLSSCSYFAFGGNSSLTLNLYAPFSSVKFSGGGSSTYDVCGQVKCNDITVNGHYNFHFDEVLAFITPPTRYLPAKWKEIY